MAVPVTGPGNAATGMQTGFLRMLGASGQAARETAVQSETATDAQRPAALATSTANT
jgi:hypothetical protein